MSEEKATTAELSEFSVSSPTIKKQKRSANFLLFDCLLRIIIFYVQKQFFFQNLTHDLVDWFVRSSFFDTLIRTESCDDVCDHGSVAEPMTKQVKVKLNTEIRSFIERVREKRTICFLHFIVGFSFECHTKQFFRTGNNDTDTINWEERRRQR